jgi:serine O-acetyltransferase
MAYIRQQARRVKTPQAVTMAEAAIMTSENLWQEIRGEAQRAAAADPVFGRALVGLILAHDDFTAALADLIGRRLAVAPSNVSASRHFPATPFAGTRI